MTRRYLRREALRRSYLQLSTLALRSKAWRGVNSECVCSPSKLEPSSARFTTIKTDQASSTSCKERSLTIETALPRTMDQEWAGPRIETPHTGLRTEEPSRRWRSRSTSSGPNSTRPTKRSGDAGASVDEQCAPDLSVRMVLSLLASRLLVGRVRR